MRAVLNILSKTAELPALLAALALFAMMVMTFADVMLRSAFNTPIEAATELIRILMAIIVFSVLPVVSARGMHISVDLLDRYFSGWTERLRDGLMALICGAMLWWPAERVVALAERARSYGDVTEYLAIPQFYIGWMIAIMTYITAAALVGRGLAILVWGRLDGD